MLLDKSGIYSAKGGVTRSNNEDQLVEELDADTDQGGKLTKTAITSELWYENALLAQPWRVCADWRTAPKFDREFCSRSRLIIGANSSLDFLVRRS